MNVKENEMYRGELLLFLETGLEIKKFFKENEMYINYLWCFRNRKERFRSAKM